MHVSVQEKGLEVQQFNITQQWGLCLMEETMSAMIPCLIIRSMQCTAEGEWVHDH